MTGSIQSDITKLRPESQALLHRMLDQDAEINEIRRAVYRLSGERVSLPALGYYAAQYTNRQQQRQQARAQTDDFIRLAGKKGVKVSDLLRAALIDRLIGARRDGSLKKADLFKLEDAERRRREFELKRSQARQSAKHKKREMELKERQARLDEQRFEIEREKAQADLVKLDRKAKLGESLTAGDVRRMREIYEIYDEWQPEPDQTATDEANGTSQEIETE
ncbi:MAG: hypothetical protein O7E51_05060 [Acidobacteria bacterium]|nr:hypothetical protein [Acidobacteriota bacterium]